MANYKSTSTDTLFLHGTLEDLLPADSLARDVGAVLDLLDFTCFDECYRNDSGGSAAIPPRALVGVWILALLRGVTSSVALARLCHTDVEFRWMMEDMGVEKSTLADFRKHRLQQLSDLSLQALAGLARSGRLPARAIGVDGTMLRAAASCGKVTTPRRLAQKRAKLRSIIEEKLSAPEQGEELDTLREREAQLSRALEELKRLGIAEKESVPLSEPQSSCKKLKNGSIAPAHNVQISVDLESGAIIHSQIIPGKNDSGQLEPQVENAKAVLARAMQLAAQPKSTLQTVAADAQYHDTKQVLRLEGQGIACHVPRTRETNRKCDGYSIEHFTHDPQNDTMLCPAGKQLRRRAQNKGATAITYQAKAADCQQCALKPQCRPNARSCGRSVNLPLYAEQPTVWDARLDTNEGKHRMAQRRTSLEGAYARLVEHLNLRRCRMWGSAGAQAEVLWRQVTHNLCLLADIWKPLIAQAA